MDNQKGFASIVIVLIVVVLLAGGILAWQYFGAPKEEVKNTKEVSPTDTTGGGGGGGQSISPPIPLSAQKPEEIILTELPVNWKVYRNEKYGFEIGYPQDWTILHEGYYKTDIPYEVSFTRQDLKDSYVGAAPISVVIELVSLEEARKVGGMIEFDSGEKIIVNNIVSEKQFLNGPEGNFVRILVPKGEELTYGLSFSSSNFREVFNQMLPTFKFFK